MAPRWATYGLKAVRLPSSYKSAATAAVASGFVRHVGVTSWGPEFRNGVLLIARFLPAPGGRQALALLAASTSCFVVFCYSALLLFTLSAM